MIQYKINILSALKEAGYSTTVLRQQHILAEKTIQHLRTGENLNTKTLDVICRLLNCQPGDLLKYVPDKTTEEGGKEMFNYNFFKREMFRRGHEVRKNGKYITIVPNNNYNGYGEGFRYATDIVEGFEDALGFVGMTHCNSLIYSAKFKIL